MIKIETLKTSESIEHNKPSWILHSAGVGQLLYSFFRKVMNVYVRSILTFSRILIPIDSIHKCLKAFDQIRPLTASK